MYRAAVPDVLLVLEANMFSLRIPLRCLLWKPTPIEIPFM